MGAPILVKHGKEERRDDRRAAILDIAHAAFLADGYAATSMSTIAAKVGGSKATLYNYFSSKEELFDAVISNRCEQLQSMLYDAQIEGGDLRSALQTFGERFLKLLLEEESIATYRLVMAECGRFPEIGRTMYNRGKKQGRARLAEYLDQAVAAGELRDCDPILMAGYFFDLCMSGVHLRRLWNVEEPTDEDVRANIARAVAIFFVAFGGERVERDAAARLCARP